MNAQHSSATDRWYTPKDIIVRARAVLERIDFDPASDPDANKRVLARRYFSEHDDGLTLPWPAGSVFLNPPGGKVKNKSRAALFWQRLMEHRASGQLTHAIFVAFSLEQLQTTQGLGVLSLGEFPFCIPSSRLRYVSPTGAMSSPTHSSLIAYVPGTVNRGDAFAEWFADLGVVVAPASRGGKQAS